MKINKLLLYFFSISTLFSCQSDFSEEFYSLDCQEDSLYKHASYPIGVAVDLKLLKEDSRYREIIKGQFNSLTAENVMKPKFLQPEHRSFYWNDADYLVSFAKAHNKVIHGHTLVWEKQIPDWMLEYEGDWEEMMTNHIYTIIGRYKNDVNSWDVVNEALSYGGGIKNNIWKEKLGEDYLYLAYKAAEEADAEALLFYNETFKFDSTDTWKRKINGTLKIIDKVRSKGGKVDGIGFQMHISVWNGLQFPDIAEAFKMITEKGLKIRVSELDVSLPEKSARYFDIQQIYYESVIDAFNNLPSEYQHGITVWGVSDKDSWLNFSYPLIYDENYSIKPSYCGLLNSLN